MEQAIPARKLYTVQEYFRLAEASPTKLEYRAGELIDMAGATPSHLLICTNFIRRLAERLDGTPCVVVGSDQRVWTADDRYCYPDVTVRCGEGEYLTTEKQKLTLINPTVLIEVASPTTASTDRGEKFERYINLPSLQEYFLVEQDEPRLRSFYRQVDGIWAVGPSVQSLDGVAEFRSLGVSIPLREIYANVTFPAPGEPIVDAQA